MKSPSREKHWKRATSDRECVLMYSDGPVAFAQVPSGALSKIDPGATKPWTEGEKAIASLVAPEGTERGSITVEAAIDWTVASDDIGVAFGSVLGAVFDRHIVLWAMCALVGGGGMTAERTIRVEVAPLGAGYIARLINSDDPETWAAVMSVAGPSEPTIAPMPVARPS